MCDGDSSSCNKPVAFGQSVIVNEDTSIYIELEAIDPNGDDLIYKIEIDMSNVFYAFEIIFQVLLDHHSMLPRLSRTLISFSVVLTSTTIPQPSKDGPISRSGNDTSTPLLDRKLTTKSPRLYSTILISQLI